MKKLVIFCIILISVTAFAQTQGAPYAILEYYDSEDDVYVTDLMGNDLFPYFGMELEEGFQIETFDSNVELRLHPNGSIIRLSSNTTFVIEELQTSNDNANAFTLIAGKMRAVAARAGIGEQYSVQTPSAVAGIRGTDFGMEYVEGVSDSAFVKSGLIDFTNLFSGESVSLGAGMFANTLAETFEAVMLDMDALNALFEDLDFDVLSPDDVPVLSEDMEEAIDDDEDDELVEDDLDAEEDDTAVAVTTDPVPAVEDTDTDETAISPDLDDDDDDPLMQWLRDILGMEIGSIVIDGNIWSKAVLQPNFQFGKLKLGLYLPIIYQTELFNPDDWYRPAGNDEWSFGRDQDDFSDKALDFMSDLALKIKYFEWGELRDPFFIKIGNLNNMTVGHGILMKDYANDADFPVVRRIGFNMGLDMSSWGFELVANDLSAPEIFGGRVYNRPLGLSGPAFGLSSIIDIAPESILIPEGEDSSFGNPIFFNTSLDFDWPFLETALLSVVFFGDVAALLPYYRMPITGVDEAGFAWNAVYHDGSFRNYGIATGFFGNLAFMDWRLEYRYFTGTFRPAMYNATYDRTRGQYVEDLAIYMADPGDKKYETAIMGLFGSGGFELFDSLILDIAYFAPFPNTGWPADEVFKDDYFSIKLDILPDVIPFVSLYGSVSYIRKGLVYAFLTEEATLFDVNTVMKGEIVYEVSPNLDIVLLVSTYSYLDADGQQAIAPTFSIDTKIHF